MLFKRIATSRVMLITLPFLLSLVFFSGISQAQQQASSINLDEIVPLNENNKMYVGIYLVECYGFDYKSGGYTFDFFLRFLWSDPNIKTADWYLMNGYPTYSGAKILVDENKTGDIKWELYRVRANLNAEIEPINYPFDRINLPIAIELVTHNYDVSLVWANAITGVAPQFNIGGWSNLSYKLTTTFNNYPLRVEPQADMVISMDRNFYGAFMKSVFPLLIFCFVSGVCFLFEMIENNAFGLRVGIGTSMLISAVLFNIAEQNVIPPVTSFTLYNAIIAAAISFLALFLTITILGYVVWKRNQNTKKVDRINKIGFVITLAIPIVILMLFYFSTVFA